MRQPSADCCKAPDRQSARASTHPRACASRRRRHLPRQRRVANGARARSPTTDHVRRHTLSTHSGTRRRLRQARPAGRGAAHSGRWIGERCADDSIAACGYRRSGVADTRCCALLSRSRHAIVLIYVNWCELLRDRTHTRGSAPPVPVDSRDSGAARSPRIGDHRSRTAHGCCGPGTKTLEAPTPGGIPVLVCHRPSRPSRAAPLPLDATLAATCRR